MKKRRGRATERKQEEPAEALVDEIGPSLEEAGSWEQMGPDGPRWWAMLASSWLKLCVEQSCEPGSQSHLGVEGKRQTKARQSGKELIFWAIHDLLALGSSKRLEKRVGGRQAAHGTGIWSRQAQALSPGGPSRQSDAGFAALWGHHFPPLAHLSMGPSSHPSDTFSGNFPTSTLRSRRQPSNQRPVPHPGPEL